jgi:hypothetical protein
MRRSLLPIIVFLLLYVSAFTEAEAQMTAVRCNRSTIESFPEQEKRPVLLYMDESRKVADEFMQLLAKGKFDEIYNLHKWASINVQGKPSIKMDLATFEQKQGRITHFEYRNQDIIWYLTNPEIDLRESVGTWYSVKTTKTKSGLVSLLVETNKKARPQQRPIFEASYFQDYSKVPIPSAPSWLSKKYPPIQQGSCPTIKGSLTVKAP